MALESKSGFSDESTVQQVEGSSPEHLAFVRSQFNLPRGFEFDATYRHQSALPGVSVKAFDTADLRLGWQTKKGFELSVAGQNLLSPSHFEFPISAGPLIGVRRTIVAKLTWRSE